jgi:hypothetical protein
MGIINQAIEDSLSGKCASLQWRAVDGTPIAQASPP